MTRTQQIRLATRLESYAPAINSVEWDARGIYAIVVDQPRIDPRFLAALRQLGEREGFTVLLSGPAGDARHFLTVTELEASPSRSA